MNKNEGSRRHFRIEEGKMDEIRKILNKEGTYMCKEENGYDVYNFYGCTVLFNGEGVIFGAKLHVTTGSYSYQLAEKAGTKLEEITKNGN